MADGGWRMATGLPFVHVVTADFVTAGIARLLRPTLI